MPRSDNVTRYTIRFTPRHSLIDRPDGTRCYTIPHGNDGSTLLARQILANLNDEPLMSDVPQKAAA